MFKRVSVIPASDNLARARIICGIADFSGKIAVIADNESLKNSLYDAFSWCVATLSGTCNASLDASIQEAMHTLSGVLDQYGSSVIVPEGESKREEACFSYDFQIQHKGSHVTLETDMRKIATHLIPHIGPVLVPIRSSVAPSKDALSSPKFLIDQRSKSFNDMGDVVATGHTAFSLQARFSTSDFKSAVIPLPEISAQNIAVNLFFPKSMFTDLLVNPYVESAQAATEAFAIRHGLYTDVFPKFQEMKFAWLCGFAYSTPSFLQSEEKLSIASDWITSLFSHNDAVDGLDVSQDEHAFKKLKLINNRLMAIVNTPLHEMDFLDECVCSPREKAMAEVYSRLVSYASEDSDLDPFRKTFEDYLRATEWECRNRELKLIPRFKEYQWRRRDTGAAYNAFALGLLLIGVPRLMGGNTVRTLADSVCDSIGVVNDMHSYWKEARYPDVYENAVKLQKIECKLSITESFVACEKTHKRSIEDVRETLTLLEGNWGKIVDPREVSFAKEGVEFIRNWALANALWSEGTGRYAIDGKSKFKL